MVNILKRGDGTYRFTVSIGRGSNGKYQRKTKTFKIEEKLTPKKEKELVEEEFLKFKREVLSGEFIAPSRNSKMTFAKFTTEWWEKVAVKEYKQKTLNRQRNILDTRLIKEFGHMYLDEITYGKIEDFLHNLEKDGARLDRKTGGLSSGQRKSILDTLKSIFKYAAKRKLIKDNPIKDLSVKLDESKSIEPYNKEEIERLLTALQDEPTRWKVYNMLAILSGARRGELLGLEWKHIDWEKGTIFIENNLVDTKNGEPVITTPKSKSGIRPVLLSEPMIELLKQYREEQKREQLLYEWNGGDYRFIFCHEDGKAIYHDTPSKWFKRFLQRHNLRFIRLHDLRHLNGTLQNEQGVDMKTIQKRLGHSKISTTLDLYVHSTQETNRVATEKLENVLNFKNYVKKA
ncbi:tyrosine-type recombinase/integrase [Bacillus sp. AFS017336]|uniref:tyrosine-type recombinase/integrase n=1 Tax=Bacillus sp. AFS017336 TaxID=2033489 RepID=UPI000BF10A0F|nr:tyrosine-type recombinase/integrase [Bacillus sp. AFS017336]PEL07789.1 site-specific integrase [Bacillus sp. AFS017336]